jgi:hypothetical protein
MSRISAFLDARCLGDDGDGDTGRGTGTGGHRGRSLVGWGSPVVGVATTLAEWQLSRRYRLIPPTVLADFFTRWGGSRGLLDVLKARMRFFEGHRRADVPAEGFLPSLAMIKLAVLPSLA